MAKTLLLSFNNSKPFRITLYKDQISQVHETATEVGAFSVLKLDLKFVSTMTGLIYFDYSRGREQKENLERNA